MRARATAARPVRTQADRLVDAIRFIWSATDRAVRATTAEQLAAMKGVSRPRDIAVIRDALAKRLAADEART